MPIALDRPQLSDYADALPATVAVRVASCQPITFATRLTAVLFSEPDGSDVVAEPPPRKADNCAIADVNLVDVANKFL